MSEKKIFDNSLSNFEKLRPETTISTEEKSLAGLESLRPTSKPSQETNSGEEKKN